MKQIETKKSQKIAEKYECINCHYNTSNKSDYKKHLSTVKHKFITNETNETNLKQNVLEKSEKFHCVCGSIYNSRTTLWRHKKKCLGDDENIIDGINIKDKDALVLHLLKQNGELQKSLIEMSKEKSITNNNNNNNTNTNCHNKTFNLNLFLNETCKDALNITDFVSSIKPSLEDLENTGRRGYIEGISNIILKNLNNLGEHQRPIHCSDFKREVLYIKDNDKWEKESIEKPILTKAIKVIANENIKQIKNWRDQNPDCTDAESKKNNLYLKIVSNSMNGSTAEESHKNIHKIISNVAKETVIQKE